MKRTSRHLPPKQKVIGARSEGSRYREVLECGHTGDNVARVPSGIAFRHCWECFLGPKEEENPTQKA